jgi:hypothetical protein
LFSVLVNSVGRPCLSATLFVSRLFRIKPCPLTTKLHCHNAFFYSSPRIRASNQVTLNSRLKTYAFCSSLQCQLAAMLKKLPAISYTQEATSSRSTCIESLSAPDYLQVTFVYRLGFLLFTQSARQPLSYILLRRGCTAISISVGTATTISYITTVYDNETWIPLNNNLRRLCQVNLRCTR